MRILMFVMMVVRLLVASKLDIETYKADFVQTITNTSGKKIEYDGNLAIEQPGKMVWNYKTPVEKHVHISKLSVVIIEPELEQAIFSSLQKEINMIDILNNVKHISKNIYEANMNNTRYILTTKNKILRKIEYSDNIDNKIVINFKSIQQNKPLKGSIFDFSIPIEYDIIRNN